ncbi:serine/arginine repetitive matrix protein 1 [Kryptolebias marmoratus]|nr:serine/arginine repetitive matrix protein 1 [Kryptolebias marmoratus]
MASPLNKIDLIKKSVHKEVLKSPRRQEHGKPGVSTARWEPGGPAPESVHKRPPAETSSRVGKDVSAFLQKVNQTIRSKPPKKSTVKAPLLPPPEPEDDFFILEDDAPLWVSIPSRNVTKKRQKPSRTSSSDKESVAESEPKDRPVKQQEPETADNKPDIQAVNQKTNDHKKKTNEKSNESENFKDSLSGPEGFPAGDPMEQQKPKKKKKTKTISSEALRWTCDLSRVSPASRTVTAGDRHQLPVTRNGEAVKKNGWMDGWISSEESVEAEGPEGRAGVEAEQPAQKTQPEKRKSAGRKSRKDGKETTPTKRTGTIKESRKRPRGLAETAAADGVWGERNPELSDEAPAGTEHLGSFSDKEIRKSEADEETKQTKPSAESADSSSKELVRRRRRRKPTGCWWVSSGEAENPLPPKKPKQNNKEPSAAPSTVRDKKDKPNRGRNQKRPAQSNETKGGTNEQTKKSKTKGKKVKEPDGIIGAAEEKREIPDEDVDQEKSSPLVFTPRDLSLHSGGQIFQRVYHNSSSENISVPSSAPEDQPRNPELPKRRRKPPQNWWEVGPASSPPQRLHSKEPEPQGELKKPHKQQKPGLGAAAAGCKPPGGALATPLRPLATPKSSKRSEAAIRDIFTSAAETPAPLASRGAHQSKRRLVTPRPAAQEDAGSTAGSRDGGERSGAQHKLQSPPGRMSFLEDTLRVVRSGPSSMIEMEKYEGGDADLQPPRVQMVLSASDLCSAPLKPLTLHSKDKSALTEWFQSLWSSAADDDAVITPDHFQWYFYQDRALGIQADLNSTSICSGKLLMGSFSKKPLWVDHSATTVFNLLTSSVSVTVDGSVSRYSPGQAFMVECGQAYSIHNTNAQPAVLYFTRVSAESSD